MERITYLDHTKLKMPTRKQESHKGDYGRLLCVCGSAGMAGAAYLCAKAAYRSGAGLVEILTSEDNRIILQTLIPEAIVTAYDSASIDLEKLKASVSRADAIVAGCGLGKSEVSQKILECVLRKKNAPTLLDADALNIISERKELFTLIKDTVITPHIMEMSRLSKRTVTEIAADVPTFCEKFARENELICVLKCHESAVSEGKGKVYINKFGNSGMSTGGSGDVLAGIIGGILAQNKCGELSIFDAAVLGVYLHSRAGDDGAQRLGEYSLMASDIIDSLPRVIKSL